MASNNTVLLNILLWITTTTAQNHDFVWSQQKIESTQHSGIIFEKLQNVTFSQDYRNVTIMIDLTIREKAITNLEFAFRELRIKSGHSVPENFSTFGPHFEILYEKFQDVKEAIIAVKSLKEMPNTMTEGDLIQNRLKKNIYDSSKPQMFEKGGSIFVESALSRKMKQLINVKEEIYYNMQDLPLVQGNSSKLVKNQYTTHLYSTLIQMQELLDEHLENFKAIKKSLLSVKENKLYPSIIEAEMLQRIEKSFDIYYHTCKFPVMNITHAGELNQWIEASYGTDQDQVYFEIQIPCVNEKRVQLYEVKSMPIPQIIDGSIHSAHLEPQSRYILKQGNSYYHAKYEELQECKHSRKLIICPAQWFVFQNHTSCEGTLIANPKITNYRTCQIVYKKEHQDYMILIKSTGNVLHTFSKPNVLAYRCPGTQGKIYLNGTGLLKIKAGCNVEFQGMNMQGSSFETNPNHKLILPIKTLEVQKLTRIFENPKTKEIFEALSQEEGKHYFWEMEREVQEIAENRYLHSIYRTALVSYSIIIALMFIAVFITSAIIIYFKYIYDTVEDDVNSSSYQEGERIELA